jgi:hypothetical protein
VKPEEHVDVRKSLEPEHGLTVLCEDLDPRRVVLLSNQPNGMNCVSVSHRSSVAVEDEIQMAKTLRVVPEVF